MLPESLSDALGGVFVDSPPPVHCWLGGALLLLSDHVWLLTDVRARPPETGTFLSRLLSTPSTTSCLLLLTDLLALPRKILYLSQYRQEAANSSFLSIWRMRRECGGGVSRDVTTLSTFGCSQQSGCSQYPADFQQDPSLIMETANNKLTVWVWHHTNQLSSHEIFPRETIASPAACLLLHIIIIRKQISQCRHTCHGAM